MDIKMNREDITTMINLYFAIKGLKVDSIMSTSDYRIGLNSITLKNVTPQKYDIEKVIKKIQSK